MITVYLATPISFWESIVSTRTSVCQRMKFTDRKYPVPGFFAIKADAFQAVQGTSLCLISETKYSDTSWKYQLLFFPKQ